MSALGVGVAAGLAAGVWSAEWSQTHATQADAFLPTATDDEERYRLLASIPATLYLIGSFAMLVVSSILKNR